MRERVADVLNHFFGVKQQLSQMCVFSSVIKEAGFCRIPTSLRSGAARMNIGFRSFCLRGSSLFVNFPFGLPAMWTLSSGIRRGGSLPETA